MSRMVSFIVLLAVVVLFGVLFYQVMIGFLLPLFLAALLVVIFRPLHRWILAKLKGRDRIAAGLTTAAIMLIVLAPMTWILIFALAQGVSLVTGFNTAEFKTKVAHVRERFGLRIPAADRLHQIEDALDDLAEAAEAGHSVVDHRAALQSLLDKIDRMSAALEKVTAGKMSDADLEGLTAANAKQAAENLDALRGPIAELLDRNLGPGHADYLPTVQRAQLAYKQLFQDLAGGPVRAYFADLANPSDDDVRRLRDDASGKLRTWLLSVTGAAPGMVGGFLLDLCIMVLALYYFQADGPKMIHTAMRLSPLDDRYEEQLLTEFDSISRSVVLATLLSALAQGVLAGVGFYFAGLESVILLTLLTMLLALVPFIGAAAVWFPVCLWLFFIEERSLAAVLLGVYGVGIVSMADNVIKPLVLHGQSNMHPLVALLSVIGGVQALGPIGILVGPMIVALLQTLLNMLHRELALMDRTSTPAGRGEGEQPSAEGA